MRTVIALLTDFGTSDAYVGVMKGVIAGITPDSTVVDITHDIEPQNIKQAAFVLKTSFEYFPKGTIFVAVVDPGVGSGRKAICVQTQGYHFITPDNGILTYALEGQKIISSVELNNPEYHIHNKSNTFDGRDVFAPVAAHIASGIEIEKFGEPVKISELKMLKPLKLIKKKKSIEAEIIYSDRFGNLITSIHKDDIPTDKKGIAIQISKHKINGLSKTFSDVKKENLLAYIGSTGYLEIGVRNGRAVDIIRINDKYIIYKNSIIIKIK